MGDDENVIKICIYKVFTDILLINAVGWPVFFIDLYVTPYQRGVFCNDQTLMYPYKKSTVDYRLMICIGYLLPLFTMLLVEFLSRSKDDRRYTLLGLNIPNWFYNFYCVYGMFCFGEALTHVITDTIKYLVGRLRPYFLIACAPNVCEGSYDVNKYYTDFICTKTRYKYGWRTWDMRLSFPSGHSSIAMYCMLYYAIYLQVRMTWGGSKLLKHVIQFVAVFAAFCSGLTRVSDHKHHWSDVLGGFGVGAFVAVVNAKYFSNLFTGDLR